MIIPYPQDVRHDQYGQHDAAGKLSAKHIGQQGDGHHPGAMHTGLGHADEHCHDQEEGQTRVREREGEEGDQ